MSLVALAGIVNWRHTNTGKSCIGLHPQRGHIVDPLDCAAQPRLFPRHPDTVSDIRRQYYGGSWYQDRVQVQGRAGPIYAEGSC